MGGPFRTRSSTQGSTRKDSACSDIDVYRAAQREATESIVHKIIQPLEAAGATVDVLFTLPESCSMHERVSALLHSWLQGYVVAERTVNTIAVGHALQLAYRLLHSHMLKHKVRYDYVFHTRHDIFIERNITSWPGADFEYILFQPRCVECNDHQLCAHDVAQIGVIEAKLRDPRCSIFTDDKILWTPRRYLPALMRKLEGDASNDTRARCSQQSDYTHTLARGCLPAASPAPKTPPPAPFDWSWPPPSPPPIPTPAPAPALPDLIVDTPCTLNLPASPPSPPPPSPMTREEMCGRWREEEAATFPPGACAFLADPWVWHMIDQRCNGMPSLRDGTCHPNDGGGSQGVAQRWRLFSYRPSRGEPMVTAG